MRDRNYTSKQMGDACEMLVAAEMTLAGIPAMKAPEFWPDYDVIAQPFDKQPVRISVKSRTFKRGPAYLSYSEHQDFDWIAIVLLDCDSDNSRKIFLIPRKVADKHARRTIRRQKTRMNATGGSMRWRRSLPNMKITSR